MPRRDEYTPVAHSIPFDKDNRPELEFESENVQEAIEEVIDKAAASASPGFTWGESGNVSSGAWLLNDTVPSNRTGRTFPFYNGELTEITISNENANTFTLEVYEHDGTTFTLLCSATVTAARSAVFDDTTWSPLGPVYVTKGKELAVKLSSGAAKNPVCQMILQGTRTP